MTSELWDDLHGIDKVRAVLLARKERKAKNRYDPEARRPGETPEQHESRVLFQQQQAYVRAMRNNPFLVDVDSDG